MFLWLLQTPDDPQTGFGVRSCDLDPDEEFCRGTSSSGLVLFIITTSLFFEQTGADPQVKGQEDLSSRVPDRRNQSEQNQNQLEKTTVRSPDA